MARLLLSALLASGLLVTLGWSDERQARADEQVPSGQPRPEDDPQHVRPDAGRTFERDVRPIFKAYCLDCHGARAEREGNLDLRLRRFLLTGGESGPAIVPGKPAASYLLERIRSGEMPPGDKRVPEDQVRILAEWIADGAPTAREEPTELAAGVRITPEERAFWSFQPIRRPPVPGSVVEGPRVRTPIDAFLLARLAERGLGFAPDADRLTLIRRASLDLLGLPPDPDEVRRYLQDPADDAYSRMIDRLLDSPHYGERWGRHWLDVAGYADSEGYTNADADRPWAWFYRDYVIRALNQDKPFDRFLVEQLAGDELVPPPHRNLTEEQIQLLAATGFLRMAADGTGSGDNSEAARNQTVADTIKIVSTSLLGLSVGCAQCHDHRYDPIPQEDYYQLRAILEPALNFKNWRTPQQRLVSLYTDADRAKAAEVESEVARIAGEKNEKQARYIAEALTKELEKFEEPLRGQLRGAYETPADKRSAEQNQLLKQHPSVNISPGTLYQYNQAAADDLKTFDQKIAEVRQQKPVERFLRVASEVPGQVPPTHVFHRGEFQQPKEAVLPAGLRIAAAEGQRAEFAENDASLPTTGRRLAYARWLTSGQHPLVARVLVNRVWLHHFGRGIVDTPADFGVLGQKPTHPELLDWLASEFMERGWSLKQLHRLIMNSTAYRQASLAGPEQLERDAENLLYSRWPVQRLDAEVVRDRMLAASGALRDEMYGPPVPVKPDDAGQVIEEGEPSRRSVYVQVKRTQPLALLRAFDAPVMETNCERRPASTVATQALMLMNSDFALRQAERLARRVRDEAAGYVPPAYVARLADELPWKSPWSWGYGRFEPTISAAQTAAPAAEVAAAAAETAAAAAAAAETAAAAAETAAAAAETAAPAAETAVAGTVHFTPLPHWNNGTWQGGGQLPDPAIGWVLLNAAGGHPGNAAHAAIRRWTAPEAGRYTVTGQLTHGSPNGDGVQARILAGGGRRAFGPWIARNGRAETRLVEIRLEQGETLDFLVASQAHETSDSFQWPVRITRLPDGASESPDLAGQPAWDSQAEFHGPLAEQPDLAVQVALAWQLAYSREISEDELRDALRFLRDQLQAFRTTARPPADTDPRLAAMTNLCQALFSSNEFLYVD